MHIGKIFLAYLKVVAAVTAEQFAHEPDISKGKTLSPPASAKGSHPAKSQIGNTLHGLQHQQRKQKNLQQKSQSLSHDHLHQMAQAMANSLQQGTAAVGSLKSEAEEGLHNLWGEIGDHYHALSDNIKDRLPIVRADLKKVTPYAVPVAEIMNALLARDAGFEEELYARGLDWYMDDDE